MTTPSKEITAKGFTPHRGGVNPIKSLGQNFLRNEAVIEELVGTSEPKQSDTYLEIGSGEGAITKILAPKVKKVIAVELDARLSPTLQKLSRRFGNLEIVQADILKFLRNHESIHDGKINKVIGAIPYQITSPLLHALADWLFKTKLDRVVLLIQKEAADKIAAAARSSYLSNFAQTYFDVAYIKTVPKSAFYPVPKVDGAIVRLKPRIMNQESRIMEPKRWSEFLHQGFKHPRKMLKKVFDERILKAAGIDPSQRPGDLDIAHWKNLYRFYA